MFIIKLVTMDKGRVISWVGYASFEKSIPQWSNKTNNEGNHPICITYGHLRLSKHISNVIDNEHRIC